MLDLEYFKCQIEDELEGAMQYAQYALETKSKHSDWSKMFVEMGNAEIQHADDLWKMFEEYYNSITEAYREVPQNFKDTYDCVISYYTENRAKAKYMLSLVV